MSNLLVDELPVSVRIGDTDYPIESNFRSGVLFELLFADPDYTQEEKLSAGLALWYGDGVPPDVACAVERMLWFYQCGKEERQPPRKRGRTSARVKRVYDFDVDDDYIYAAFLDQYGIDLQDVDYLHWWKFRALFRALRAENEIVKIMGYRSMELTKIKDSERRGHYARLQALYRLPDGLSEEDKVARAGAIFAGAR